jgi:hypothetical protein
LQAAVLVEKTKVQVVVQADLLLVQFKVRQVFHTLLI